LSGEQSAQLVLRRVDDLRPNPRNARTHQKRKIRDLAKEIKAIGFIGAIIVDETDMILAGHARHAAAKLLGLEGVPTITARGLGDAQKRAFVLADNKFAERAGYNREILVEELQELAVLLPDLDLDLSVSGFEFGEIDVLFDEAGEEKPEPEDSIPPTAGPTVARAGEIWQLGKHRVLCGDARDPAEHARLMQGDRAVMLMSDPPYNVAVQGHVQGRGRHKHAEFAFASGEMSDAEFRAFLTQCLTAAADVSRDGAIHYVFMDWRHVETLIGVGREVYGAMLNLVVWNKTNAGQGSFYRSQHELICVFRVGDGPHQNNVELGRHGRNRSNVWSYAGINSFGAGRDDALAMHATCKPVALVADAMRDCTSKGDLVLDPFLGSGTTIMAAEKVGRRCYGIEYEPAYVDVIVRRWQAYTHQDAVLLDDRRTFDEVAAERTRTPEPRVLAPAKELPSPPDESAGAAWVRLCDPDYEKENDA
jgi:DNA modification methylase